MEKIFNPCDECDYSFSKQNQESGMCRICEFKKMLDLEEQGKLLELPCAVGDTVWCVHIYSGGGRVPNWGEIYETKFSVGMYEDFEKTVFLTEEAAEAALKEE
ncbi:MAG: hypothetical protein K2N80_17170 [Lachnospiraceae bacterium]|nr:hypothetical protein [Lachnospiraceae bacterium]